MSAPRMSAPRMSAPRMSTPRMSTPGISTLRGPLGAVRGLRVEAAAVPCPYGYAKARALPRYAGRLPCKHRVQEDAMTTTTEPPPQAEHPDGHTRPDKRAIADHETLISLHEMSRQQLEILRSQEAVLSLLQNFASKDMPGKQREIQGSVKKILAIVGKDQSGS
jgi:hypothetical protein